MYLFDYGVYATVVMCVQAPAITLYSIVNLVVVNVVVIGTAAALTSCKTLAFCVPPESTARKLLFNALFTFAVSVPDDAISVSYTHLRAHET